MSELDPLEGMARLRESPIGRLAVILEGRPEIFPVNFAVDGDSVVIRTAAGAKLAGLVHQPVAFEADGYDITTGDAWSVVVHGHGEVIEDPVALAAARVLPLFPWPEGVRPLFVRLRPTVVTGRRFRVAGGSVSAST